VGTQLRQARERAGLSAEQIAERTKVQLYRIEALEHDNFECLPDGIYLDGIVRAYAHQVAIDPDPLIEQVRRDRAQVASAWQVGPGDLNAFPLERQIRQITSEVPAAAAVPARGHHRFTLPLLLLIAAAGWSAYFLQSTHRIERVTRPGAVAFAPEPATPKVIVPDTSSTNVPPHETTSVPASDIINVAGSWTLATYVESSSYARFEGLHLGYEIQLEQDGDHVTGTGRKVTQNGDGIGARAQTPISVDGSINGDRLTLAFGERGMRRPTEGKFVLLVDEGGTLRGRFSSTAARSSGTVEAHRLSR
jgi:transcriptional regulator with XRE-family HTH domain